MIPSGETRATPDENRPGEDTRLAMDVACITCGYNLRTLRAGTLSRVCATRLDRSTVAEPLMLRGSAMGTPARQRRGLDLAVLPGAGALVFSNPGLAGCCFWKSIGGGIR